MCGIFGLIVGSKARLDAPQVRRIFDRQFRLSESRGREASGWAIRTPAAVTCEKHARAASDLIRTPAYRRGLETALGDDQGLAQPLAVMGHSRLVTNGLQTRDENNQPISRDRVIAIHNGIIVNDEALWSEYPELERHAEVDTEVLAALIGRFTEEDGSFATAAQRALSLIRGAASVAIFHESDPNVVLATNTGSLYFVRSGEGPDAVCLFASEAYILEQLAKDRDARAWTGDVEQIVPGTGVVIDLETLTLSRFSIAPPVAAPTPTPRRRRLAETSRAVHPPTGLRRCRRCVLPETFPFIHLDEDGVCIFCRTYQPRVLKGHDALAETLDGYRRKDRPDCLVAFSGGRDSSYGLHLLKTEFDMNPVAFTYDWGMVTDLARRNQARLCGQLGVEHIIVSADIAQKRDNVRRNIEAWLRRPRLGMIPLFMAGDKQFFHYANHLMKRIGVDMVVFAVNPLEQTHFKTGFCGVDESEGGMYFDFGWRKKLALSAYYGREYLLNPRYLNRSLADTAWAFASAFFMKHDYVMPFDYLPWEEDVIDRVLVDTYDWELAPDTDSTWRIGDGTAAFYNFIYYTVTGFTENDTFRSHQIREGTIDRESALALVDKENQPRWSSMEWYAETIGFDLDRAIEVIEAMPKLAPPASSA